MLESRLAGVDATRKLRVILRVLFKPDGDGGRQPEVL